MADGLSLRVSRYPGQVNFLATDVLPIYGYAVTRPLTSLFYCHRIIWRATLNFCKKHKNRSEEH